MSSLSELYQETILHHYKSPRNFGTLEGANHSAHGHNPLCGDKVSVFLDVEDGIIRNITFEGAGCAISTASASIMTDSLKGLAIEDAMKLFGQFQEMVLGPEDEIDVEGLGKLEVFQGIRKYPVRVKCATLAWRTLEAALQKGGEEVTTE